MKAKRTFGSLASGATSLIKSASLGQGPWVGASCHPALGWDGKMSPEFTQQSSIPCFKVTCSVLVGQIHSAAIRHCEKNPFQHIHDSRTKSGASNDHSVFDVANKLSQFWPHPNRVVAQGSEPISRKIISYPSVYLSVYLISIQVYKYIETYINRYKHIYKKCVNKNSRQKVPFGEEAKKETFQGFEVSVYTLLKQVPSTCTS